MESKLKVGDRIRVFEVLKNSGYGDIFEGKQAAQINEGEILIELSLDGSPHFFAKKCMNYQKEIKHVCTMVITKLKCECCSKKTDDQRVCKNCDSVFCEECQAPYNQFSQIDYDLCIKCYDK